MKVVWGGHPEGRAHCYLLVQLRIARASKEKEGMPQQGSALPSFPGYHLRKALPQGRGSGAGLRGGSRKHLFVLCFKDSSLGPFSYGVGCSLQCLAQLLDDYTVTGLWLYRPGQCPQPEIGYQLRVKHKDRYGETEGAWCNP